MKETKEEKREGGRKEKTRWSKDKALKEKTVNLIIFCWPEKRKYTTEERGRLFRQNFLRYIKLPYVTIKLHASQIIWMNWAQERHLFFFTVSKPKPTPSSVFSDNDFQGQPKKRLEG